MSECFEFRFIKGLGKSFFEWLADYMITDSFPITTAYLELNRLMAI